MFQLETRFDEIISPEKMENGIASYQLVTKA
jgi:hypothetical protein